VIFYYLLIILMTLTASFASFFIKKSTCKETILSIIKSRYLYLGGFLYVLAAILTIWLLQRMPFSVVVPLGSITYIWTMFIARFFLQEKIGIGKIIGVFLILFGVIFIAL